MSENKPSLYNLTTDMLDLQNQLIESIDDDGVVDTLISSALEVKEKEFVEKAVAVANVYMKFDDELDLCEKRIKSLTEYRDKLKKCKQRLGDSLQLACERTGIERIDNVNARISFRSSESVEIDNLDLIPKEYLIEKVEIKPDKTAIKKAIIAGKDIQGAHIEKHKNINIK